MVNFTHNLFLIYSWLIPTLQKNKITEIIYLTLSSWITPNFFHTRMEWCRELQFFDVVQKGGSQSSPTRIKFRNNFGTIVWFFCRFPIKLLNYSILILHLLFIFFSCKIGGDFVAFGCDSDFFFSDRNNIDIQIPKMTSLILVKF